MLALNIHAGYACRHSGACCTAGWPIPVEADAAARIAGDALLPRVTLAAAHGAPAGASVPAGAPAGAPAAAPAGVIAAGLNGACPFFERAAGNLCAIQRRLGHDALPAACRHFPRVALLEPAAVRVTLSHFCPTAAWMLFRDDVDRVRVVESAPGISDRGEHEGFDARRTIPPFLRPGVATDAETCRIWEHYLIDTLDREDLLPERALACVAAAADGIRAWDARTLPLADHAARVVSRETTRTPPGPAGPDGAPRDRDRAAPLTCQARLFQAAAASVPAGLPRPAVPAELEAADGAWVEPAWRQAARPARRFLAAHAFGAWSAYLGEGLRTQVAMLAVALAVLRVEAARHAGAAGRRLDVPLFHSAIRSADLLLRHLSDAESLAAGLAGIERLTAGGALETMGLEGIS